MRFLITFTLIVVATTAIPLDQTLHDWSQFQLKFKKIYTDAKEHDYRHSIFVENLKDIERHNAQYEQGLVTWYKKVTQFTDWTTEEFLNFVNGGELSTDIDDNLNKYPVFKAPKDVSLPDFVDWRESGAVGPIKNQGSCGGCWSFSATGAVEGINQITNGELLSLSEENLLECAWDYGNKGCHGGQRDGALQYIVDHGIELEEDYPYTHGDGECHHNDSNSVVQLSGVVRVGASEDDLAAAVVKQPVTVGIDATDELKQYGGGLFIDNVCQNKRLNHAVLAIGYGYDRAGQQYWLIKNSWGPWWGESGYVRMIRNDGNRCGVATKAFYPTM